MAAVESVYSGKEKCMGRILIGGLVVLMVGAFMVIGLASEAPRGALAGIATDTPTPTASDTPTPSVSATATATATAAASGTVTASPAASGTVTASPVQPAAVPVTGGDPADGSANLALILVIGIGAIAGTAGVLAASYGLTRRS
jgi:hypothetical protein